ncbi:aminoglycoside phosphotransferase family protein [Catellatospora coxensis]|uniref:Hydroxyurea phosphotransferase n=1 Tax=Catellatospora coxensis TaxID=310354 RepID=A0A8J3L7B4_9ACTN|nr:aminoglycoside phosphotransferase family protein [Catellatospora coxensis]GIG10479.1 hydroxyurea phosphotransferase [Catellatospora coxensis]
MTEPQLLVPPTLGVVASIGDLAEGRAWLDSLPGLITELREAWSLRLGAPWTGGSCSWVAPAELPDGRAAVLKISWPHPEMMGEAAALRVWQGHGVVTLHAHDGVRHAMLLERVDPGTTLGDRDWLPAEERLLVAARLLARLWSAPVGDASGFDLLSHVTARWAGLVEQRMERLRPGFDPGLVAHGIRLLRELPTTALRRVLVHGDINPGNILAGQREPWLVIDPKPMYGDPGYDPWKLVEQIDDPFRHPNPAAVLRRRFAIFGEVTGEDPARLAAWATARRVEDSLWWVSRGNQPSHRAMSEAAILASIAGL